MEQQNVEGEGALALTNAMQIKLAERHHEDLEDFIDMHAAEFRKTVDEHPELVETFEEDPERALEELDNYLYH